MRDNVLRPPDAIWGRGKMPQGNLCDRVSESPQCHPRTSGLQTGDDILAHVANVDDLCRASRLRSHGRFQRRNVGDMIMDVMLTIAVLAICLLLGIIMANSYIWIFTA